MPARPLSGLGAGVGGGASEVERGTPTCERDLGGAGQRGWIGLGAGRVRHVVRSLARRGAISKFITALGEEQEEVHGADGARGPRRGEASSPRAAHRMTGW